MRDVNRLYGAYMQICRLHTNVPDLRIGQLFENFKCYLEKIGVNIFYIEDEELVKRFNNYVSLITKGYYEE